MTTSQHLHPALRPNPTMHPDTVSPGDDSARAAVLRVWARKFGTEDELLLLASSHGEAQNLNLVARATLRRTGHLRGPSVVAGDLELAPGDRIVAGPDGIGRTDRPGIPAGCPGDVRLVDATRGSAVLDFPTAGVMRLSRSRLQQASLRYGYAIPAPPGFGRRIGGLRLARPAHVGAEIA